MADRVWKLVKGEHGYGLWKSDDGLWTVTEIDYVKNLVYSAMPGDAPMGGGKWASRLTSSGVDYVTSGWSRSTATKHFRRLVQEAREVFE